MSIKRLPLTFLLGGLTLKALLVIICRLSKAPELLALVTTYDPGAFMFAEKGAALFFDQRRIAPTPGEAALFEVLLVIGFGVECLLLGFLLQWFVRRYQARRAANPAIG